MKHPIQPIVQGEHGTYRFKKNKIVEFLLDNGPFDMNMLAGQEFSTEDREQFAQLIGYSLSGFGELSYVSAETYEVAEAAEAIERESLRDRCCICGGEVDIAKCHNWDRDRCKPRHPGC